MEVLIIIACLPFGLLLGMTIGRMLPVVGDLIGDFMRSSNEFMKYEIGVSISELFVTVTFSAMSLAFWQIPNFDPEWLSLVVKVSLPIISILLVLLMVLKIIDKQTDKSI